MDGGVGGTLPPARPCAQGGATGTDNKDKVSINFLTASGHPSCRLPPPGPLRIPPLHFVCSQCWMSETNMGLDTV